MSAGSGAVTLSIGADMDLEKNHDTTQGGPAWDPIHRYRSHRYTGQRSH